jgi:hypothetical protein
VESGVFLLLEHAAQLLARIAIRGKSRWLQALCATLIGAVVVTVSVYLQGGGSQAA